MVLSLMLLSSLHRRCLLTPLADIWPREMTICLGVMRIQTIFHFLGTPWGKAKHRALTHSRLREEEPFHYPSDYIRNLWCCKLPFLWALWEKLPLSLTCGETKAVGDSEICLEDLWEEICHLWSCSFAWYSLSSSLQFSIQPAAYRSIYSV